MLLHGNLQKRNKDMLMFAFLFTTAFALFEIIAGIKYESLALLSEGIHMLSDGASLGLGVLAAWMGMKLATKSKTFGFRRFETIAAFINGLTLIIIPIYVLVEAIKRMGNPREIESEKMMIVAIIGLIINLIVAFVLSRGDTKNNLNVKAAALHVLSDLLSSVATIIASLLITNFGWYMADPIVSFVVAIAILSGGFKITKESFNVLMEGAPKNLNVEEIEKQLKAIPEVIEIKEVRVWSIASGMDYINIHAKIKLEANYKEVLKEIEKTMLKHSLRSTIQLEQ